MAHACQLALRGAMHRPKLLRVIVKHSLLTTAPNRSLHCGGGGGGLLSQYHPYFQEPMTSKRAEEMSEEEMEGRRYSRVKAAPTDRNPFFYTDPLIMKFTNTIMWDGNKRGARKLIEDAFTQLKLWQISKWHRCQTPEERAQVEINPRVIFHQAFDNITPLLLVMKCKRGGSTYQVPVATSLQKRQVKAMQILKECGRDRRGVISFSQRLAQEIMEAYNNRGKAVQKKQEIHRVCEANRAYAHYRWG